MRRNVMAIRMRLLMCSAIHTYMCGVHKGNTLGGELTSSGLSVAQALMFQALLRLHSVGGSRRRSQLSKMTMTQLTLYIYIFF